MLQGSEGVLDTVCKQLGGIKPGQTTKDGKFTVVEVECQGACSNAPMMVIGDDFYVRHSLKCLHVSNPTTGGPFGRHHQENHRSVPAGRETQAWPTER